MCVSIDMDFDINEDVCDNLILNYVHEAKKMKIGIIGCGGIAPYHIGSYKKLKDAEVVALCDLNIDRAKALANRFNIKKTYSDYWDMFDEGLDYVDICTPVSTVTSYKSELSALYKKISENSPVNWAGASCT